MKPTSYLSFALAALVAVAGFAAPIQPGDNVQEELQEALILAEPGDVIELGEGTFNFTMGLSLDVDGVVVQGQGHDKTVLSFKNQNAGSEGLTVTSDNVVLRDFAIEDTVGDAIKTKGCDTISFINVRTEWTGGPKETNGAYGLYPVESKNVLIDGCIAIGASDAGIYVGQSQNIIVRNSRAEYNVAGIEIENCYNADVYNNVATKNTGGILVFDLPNLPQQGGHNVRVFANKSYDNSTPNFAPAGNIVGTVPTGTGLIIMANRNVEVFENEFTDNGTTNILIIGYAGGKGELTDESYYQWPEAVHIHNNTIKNGGFKPMGTGLTMTAALGKDTLPDIVWDGRMNPKKAADGKLPKSDGIYITGNGDATFANLDLDTMTSNPSAAKPSTDLSAHAGSLPRLDPVKLPQDDS